MLPCNNTILLAEDNPDDVFIFKKALKTASIGHPMQVVSDGQKVIDYLTSARKQSDPEKYPFPCILFLDLKMPYLDGFQVLEWIRKQPELASLVVVVLSSSDLTRDINRAYELGARSYLVKPPSPEDICEIMVAFENLWAPPGNPMRGSG
jgi:CheY-like chemotaxis protein